MNRQGNTAMHDLNLERIAKLMQHHKGSANPITSKRIGIHLGIENDGTSSTVRALVKETISKFEIPIGGNDKGYYIIDDAIELSLCIEGLDNRITGIENRKNSIIEAYHAYQKNSL